MSTRWGRWLVFLNCLALGTVGVSSRAVAADSSKTWPSKKKKHHHGHKTHHKVSTSSKTSGAAKASSAAPADDDANDEGEDESADNDKEDKDDKQDKNAESPKTKTKTKKSDDDAREASDEGGEHDEAGDDAVIHRKAHARAPEGGAAPVALEVAAGPRAMHRTFDFNDPLSNHQAGVAPPYSYALGVAPAPFLDLGLYPAAFATRGFAANIGVIASYEKLLATKTESSSSSTLAQQFQVGLRARLPLGDHEAAVSAAYGKQTFHVTDADPTAGTTGTVPNVDYTFVAVGADGRLRLAPVTLGAHVGTRLVMDTGALGKVWFSTVKTTSIEAGVSVGYHLTPIFEVVAGADFLRYAFDFNPVQPGAGVIAGGAVDQYISGYLALRVSITGS
jgi:hypothetical protein